MSYNNVLFEEQFVSCIFFSFPFGTEALDPYLPYENVQVDQLAYGQDLEHEL